MTTNEQLEKMLERHYEEVKNLVTSLSLKNDTDTITSKFSNPLKNIICTKAVSTY